MKVLVSDGIEKVGSDLMQQAGLEVVIKNYPPEELVKEIVNYEAIIVRSATKVTKEVIDAGTKLKAIGRGGVGVDNIEVEYAKSKGIGVFNTPGASSQAVAELAIAHMFALSRFLYTTTAEMREGKWPKKAYAGGVELTGKIFGLLGFGNIGKEAAKRALGLGMKVIAFDPFVKETDLDVKLCSKDEVLANSDYLSLHLPLIKGEPVPVGKEELVKMKKTAFLINCARGGVVDEGALLDALKNKIIAGAGVDVFINEPITDTQKELLNQPNISATPHLGASTNEAQDRVGLEIAQKIIDALKK